MKHRVVCVSFTLIIATVGACSKSTPAQPSASTTTTATSAANSTASIAAPRPLQPPNAAPIRNVDQPVTLVAANAVITQTTPVTYTFEIATDTAFATKVQTKDNIAEGANGQTSVRLDPLPPAADYYWHARATGGGTTGVYGPAYKLTIGPAVTVSAPVVIAPVSGAQTSARPTFRVRNAVRTGPVGTITYRFEVSTSAAFGSLVAAATVAEGVNETGWTPNLDLAIDATLFWRATALDAGSGVSSAATAAQTFTTSMALDLSKVVFLNSPDVSGWAQTGTLLLVEQDGAGDGPMCTQFTDPGWPDSPWPYGKPGDDPNFGVFANQWYFAKINGTWYGGAGEWIYRGAGVCKAGQGTRTIGPDSGFGSPFSGWVPKVGELVGYMISSVARPGVRRTVDQRTNIIVQPWRDTSLGSARVGRRN
jgi:hypothetical protein